MNTAQATLLSRSRPSAFCFAGVASADRQLERSVIEKDVVREDREIVALLVEVIDDSRTIENEVWCERIDQREVSKPLLQTGDW